MLGIRNCGAEIVQAETHRPPLPTVTADAIVLSCELRSGEIFDTRCAQGDFFMHTSEMYGGFLMSVEVMSSTELLLPAWLQSVFLFEQKTWYVAEVLCL